MTILLLCFGCREVCPQSFPFSRRMPPLSYPGAVSLALRVLENLLGHVYNFSCLTFTCPLP
jgi:hypothetical protein